MTSRPREEEAHSAAIGISLSMFDMFAMYAHNIITSKDLQSANKLLPTLRYFRQFLLSEKEEREVDFGAFYCLDEMVSTLTALRGLEASDTKAGFWQDASRSIHSLHTALLRKDAVAIILPLPNLGPLQLPPGIPEAVQRMHQRQTDRMADDSVHSRRREECFGETYDVVSKRIEMFYCCAMMQYIMNIILETKDCSIIQQKINQELPYIDTGSGDSGKEMSPVSLRKYIVDNVGGNELDSILEDKPRWNSFVQSITYNVGTIKSNPSLLKSLVKVCKDWQEKHQKEVISSIIGMIQAWYGSVFHMPTLVSLGYGQHPIESNRSLHVLDDVAAEPPAKEANMHASIPSAERTFEGRTVRVDQLVGDPIEAKVGPFDAESRTYQVYVPQSDGDGDGDPIAEPWSESEVKANLLDSDPERSSSNKKDNDTKKAAKASARRHSRSSSRSSSIRNGGVGSNNNNIHIYGPSFGSRESIEKASYGFTDSENEHTDQRESSGGGKKSESKKHSERSSGLCYYSDEYDSGEDFTTSYSDTEGLSREKSKTMKGIRKDVRSDDEEQDEEHSDISGDDHSSSESETDDGSSARLAKRRTREPKKKRRRTSKNSNRRASEISGSRANDSGSSGSGGGRKNKYTSEQKAAVVSGFRKHYKEHQVWGNIKDGNSEMFRGVTATNIKDIFRNLVKSGKTDDYGLSAEKAKKMMDTRGR